MCLLVVYYTDCAEYDSDSLYYYFGGDDQPVEHSGESVSKFRSEECHCSCDEEVIKLKEIITMLLSERVVQLSKISEKTKIELDKQFIDINVSTFEDTEDSNNIII